MAFDPEIRDALIEQVRRCVQERCVAAEGQVADEGRKRNICPALPAVRL